MSTYRDLIKSCSTESNNRLFVGILQSNVVLLLIWQAGRIVEMFNESKNSSLSLSVVPAQISFDDMLN
ncbi:hypothetical protein [Methylobacter sp. YRD-M1]|uniref:hypothetical protein n=1 Tax=Methylobacter sp. YRD-M1 TaxID=2911520 RepID=UPI00227A47FA|nr:hypothetical protein [Methylobacter sp. YRD-M1]WAK03703.1 hypothetical protein LZ558_07945 [Methylobacter sp. YRD-M1]